MLSNDYVENVLNTLKNKNLLNKYDKVLVDAATGVYFYLTKNKLIRVFKKDLVFKLYIQFSTIIMSVYDVPHQKLEKKL